MTSNCWCVKCSGWEISCQAEKKNGKVREMTFVRILGAAFLAALAFAATYLNEDLRITIGAVVGMLSFSLLLISRRHLGDSFSVLPKAMPLVTTGLYSKIQHPLYFFLDLLILGVIVAFDWPIVLLPWGALVVIHALQARREEKVLAAAFRSDYESYKIRTWF